MEDWFQEEWDEEPEWIQKGSSGGLDQSIGGSGDATISSSTTNAGIASGAQHIIFLIDCHAGMFEKYSTIKDAGTGADNMTNMDLSLHLIQEVLKERIQDVVKLKIGKRNGVGVLLYDTKPFTKKSKTEDKDHEINKDENHNKEDDEEEIDEEEEEDDDNDEDSVQRQVHVLMDLEPPGIGHVQTIRSCLKTNHHSRNLQTEFANENPNDSNGIISPLQTAIEEAVRIFRQASCVRNKATSTSAMPSMDTKSIWILTDREYPFGKDADTHQQQKNVQTATLVQNVARDAKENNIQIIVWPLDNKQGEIPKNTITPAFDMDAFYSKIVSEDVFEGERLKTMNDLLDGLDGLEQYWKKIRRLYWGPMVLPGDEEENDPTEIEMDEMNADNNNTTVKKAEIMVDWYRFIQLAKKPNKVFIDQYTKRETIKIKQYWDEEEIFASVKMGDMEDRKASKASLSRIRQFAPFASEDIPMSTSDLDKMRLLANGNQTSPRLKIFGFKPKTSIPWYHMMDAAYLIYPNDNLVKGSCDAFVDLRAAMIRKDVVAVGEVLHRVHWSSRLVAIIPLEVNDTNDSPPPGMMVVTLPFEDDIRVVEEDEAYQAWIKQQDPFVKSESAQPDTISSEDMQNLSFPSRDLMQAAKALISKHALSNVELGENFDNAALIEFFNYLENVALELPVLSTEPESFDTRPNEAKLSNILEDEIETFRQALPDDIDVAKGGSRARNPKRKKELPPDETGLDWQDLYLSDELHGVKISNLKSYLRSVGAPLSGTKGVLVDRVAEFIKKSIEVDNTGKIKTEM